MTTNFSEPEASLVILGLGSNKGPGRDILIDAAHCLSRLLKDCRCSSLFISKPMYVLDQDEFINCAVSGYFSGNPYELLEQVHGIEGSFGRDRTKERRRGERSLDIDILLFGRQIIQDSPVLEIPHPGLLERKFALLPLLELVPDAVDPRNGDALWKVYQKLGPQGIYYAEMDVYNLHDGNYKHG